MNMTGKVIEATELKDFIEESNKGLVVIDFYADWCAPCRALSPTLERIAKELKFTLVKVNVDKAQGEASKFGVQGIPSVFLIKDEKLVDKFVGARDADFIKTKIAKWI